MILNNLKIVKHIDGKKTLLLNSTGQCRNKEDNKNAAYPAVVVEWVKVSVLIQVEWH